MPPLSVEIAYRVRMPPGGCSRTVTVVSTRTPVFIYAADPLSAAGAKAQLLGEPSIELVGPIDLDRARVALVVAEAADETVAKVARAIQRDGVPHVVLVAAHFEENGVVLAVAAGVSGFLRRAEATSARLVELIRGADRAGCQLPEGLLRRAASVQLHSVPNRPDVIELSEPARDRSPVSTAIETRLSGREAEVLRLVADGYDTADVAEELAFSESTIKGVLAKLMLRLEARNRCHAVAIVLRQGLI
jgi:DNA-binding NarL/FixJ family response regulator